ncbi:class I adenylate-forming enzyme family protein [Sporosarcina newyorkensis]|nr:long-chain-fatty-acid--CoA ligase [Sporosarcina newyorkensis]
MDIGTTLARNARRTPDKEAIYFKDHVYTYGRLNREVNKLAHGLIARGIEKGDKVAILMKNSDMFVIAFYAVMKVGGVAVPINFRLTQEEVRYILNDSDASAVLFDEEYAVLVNQAVADNQKVLFQVSVGEKAVGEQIKMAEILTKNDADPSIEVDESDDAEILYTSGTTGRPKGALFDHHRVLHVAFSTAIMMKISPDDNLLHVAPLFHSAQLNLFMITGTFLGSTQVIHQEFDPRQVLQSIEKYKISIFFAVPTMYNYLLLVPDRESFDLTSVKRCGYGAAPMPVALLEKSIAMFKNDQFHNMCGLTEAGPGGIILPPEKHKDKIGAGGKAMLNTEVRVVSDTGDDVLPGQVGEFIIKSEMVMKGYYKNPEETRKALRDGWLYTGDLALIDEEGFITLVDRKKDMIISGGENVYSTEVEQILYKHPKLMDAAIIGLPDEVWGEKVVAIVVPNEGEVVDEEEIKTFCGQHLAKYKVPTQIFVEKQIPRNASGKVLKYRIREALSNGKPVNN